MTTANRFSALFKTPTPTKSSLPDDKSSYANSFPPLGGTKEVPEKLDLKPKIDIDVKAPSFAKKTVSSPSLGETKQVPAKVDLELVSDLELKPKIDIDDKASSSAKKTVTKIILGPRSYEEQLTFNRTDAYEILADKEKLASSLTKTRMCNSVDKNEPCTHGDKCRFAHNLTELKISTCIFEDRCRFVRMWNGKLYNNGDKICNHKHPQENKEDFMSRVGLDRYNKKSKETLLRPASTQPQQGQLVPPPPTQPQQPVQFVPPPPTQPQPSTDQILIIRVPKELASQALEIAMKSGRMNIQVEII